MKSNQSLEQILSEGRRFMSAGDKAQALACYQIACQLSPEDKSIWLLRAEAAGNSPEAAECLEQVLVLDPDDAQVRSKLMLVRMSELQGEAKTRTERGAQAGDRLSSQNVRSWLSNNRFSVGAAVAILGVCIMLGLAVPAIAIFSQISVSAQPENEPLPTATAGLVALRLPPTWTPSPLPTSTRTPTITPTPVWKTSRSVTVRSGPSTAYSALGTLSAASLITIVGRSTDGKFVQIQYPDAKKLGWVSVDFVDVNSANLDIGFMPTVIVQAPVVPTRAPATVAKPTETPAPRIDFVLGRSIEYIADCSKPTKILGSVYDSAASARRLNGVLVRVWAFNQLQGTVTTGSNDVNMLGYWEWAFSRGSDVDGQVAIVNADGSLRSQPISFHLTGRCDGAGAVNQEVIDFTGNR